jgi:hypothetical protein
LLWTPPRRGAETRERVHYGPLDVEDLGRVYEALLELEPGISTEPMCRLRRQKLEVVVPMVQGERYQPVDEEPNATDQEPDAEEVDDAEEEGEETTGRGKKTKVEWIEAISPGKFYLRVGLGRKSSGSYYTPHSFVRFLVQETLGPQAAERSAPDNPQPLGILELNVLDPAMGSGHFLVEVCRFLGDKLYEACRLCDEMALAADRRAESAKRKDDREQAETEARALRQRVIDLPDPDDDLLRYLPSRSPEGEQSGLSQQRAIAMCRRMVATHCLYGVDKNPLAVELAKLALWLESHAEGMPLTFLDHRFVVGDSLSGPFWERMLTRPGKPEEKLEGVLHRSLENNLRAALFDALKHVRRLEASVGATVAEMREKVQAKKDLDEAMIPFRVAAAAWAGGVMLGPEHCDDTAYAELLTRIASTRELPRTIDSSALRAMIARGLGVERISADCDELTALVQSGHCAPALSYDLTFPEVFYPSGVVHGRQGFHAVLGNPPWNKSNLEMPEFMGSLDFRFIEASTSDARIALEREYEDSWQWKLWVTAKNDEYAIERAMHVHAPNTVSETSGFGSGDADIFAPFVDRSSNWLCAAGILGMVIPSAFHVSQSLVRLRRRVLTNAKIISYFCFENTRSLFEIHKSWKFTPVLLRWQIPPADSAFPAQFYLREEEWLLSDNRTPPPYSYSAAIVERMDPTNLTFQEFGSPEDVRCAEQVFLGSVPWSQFSASRNWYLRRELHATDDRWRIRYDTVPPRMFVQSLAALVHHQPGTMHQFSDLWQGAKVSAVPIANLESKPAVLALARFFRACFRTTARATDERSSIYAILPPGTTATNSLLIEGTPEKRPNYVSIAAIAICNSYTFDWALRLRIGSKTVSKFIMEVTPFPNRAFERQACVTILAHFGLRLTCNHAAYEPLWREQLGSEWREPDEVKPFTWPVLAGDDDRWAVRAAIDAVVADAYGLSRDQYAHVLSTFSHTSYPAAPMLCVARFDELKHIGLDAFRKKYDPYHDIPLNESLPHPVIDFPFPTEGEVVGEAGELRLTGTPKKKKGKRPRTS